MLTGSCQCGDVRYEIRGEPVDLYVCHCLECRRQSASAFGISLIVRVADLVVTQGAPRIWSRAADSGTQLDCSFCPTCGSRLFHAPRPATGTLSVKGGTVDGGVDLAGATHIWTSRKMPGVDVPPGVRQFPEEPS